MLFADGKLQEYERVMQQKPGFDHRSVKTMKERDCPYCLYYDHKAKKCGLKTCTVFQD